MYLKYSIASYFKYTINSVRCSMYVLKDNFTYFINNCLVIVEQTSFCLHLIDFPVDNFTYLLQRRFLRTFYEITLLVVLWEGCP